MAAIQSPPGLPSRWGSENRYVTRIQGKWAFRILTQLQHGPTQLSQLRSTLPPGSRKKLTQYLRELERASLIVAVDRSGRMSRARYCLSDPLGIAAVHLINALAESTEEALEPEPKHRARLNTRRGLSSPSTDRAKTPPESRCGTLPKERRILWRLSLMISRTLLGLCGCVVNAVEGSESSLSSSSRTTGLHAHVACDERVGS